MSSLLRAVRCLECNQQMEADWTLQQCRNCGSGWLDARYDITQLPKDWAARVAARPTNLWRYAELLPFPDTIQHVSMGEGWTPLTRAEGLARELGQPHLWIKDERQQPTGSFKDRQASTMVSGLKAQGIDELVLASTGNAAAAYAAFCARAGIKLWVFLTSSVPAEKMRELALYGAEVVKITGTYDQAKTIAADFATRRGIRFDAGARAIPGKESMKTIAFEIVEQLGWRAPDWYVQAVSGGIGPLGVLKGFEELFEAGIIDRIPKLGIVQVEGCAPMVHAWQRGLSHAEPVQPDTLITVLATGAPGLAYTILKAASDARGGAMVAVSDGEAFRAMRRLARIEGFSAEPAASVAFAGLEKLVGERHIRPDELVVVNCSGHTFSAEKHALEDRYVLHLEMELESSPAAPIPTGLVPAFAQLDEQITTIVIIDDNPHDGRLIRRLLQNHKSYRVLEAHSGQEGLDLVHQRQPDLIVLDLTLPDMDGFTVLNALKNDPRTRDIPVTIISAKSLSLDERTRLEKQANSVWQKGNFSTRDLVSHVVAMLGGEISFPESPLPNAPRVGADAATPTFGGRPRQRVLIVDDNRLDARLMRRLLEARRRFEVVEAHSCAEALTAIEHGAPDLIILDLFLPDGAGEELLTTIRARGETERVPVIVVSARDIPPPLRTQLNTQTDSVWAKATMDRNSFLAHLETVLPE